MPYSDPRKQRQAQAQWWKAKYESDPKFRKKVLARKKKARAEWTPARKAHNRKYMKFAMARWRSSL